MEQHPVVLGPATELTLWLGNLCGVLRDQMMLEIESRPPTCNAHPFVLSSQS